MGFKPRWFCTQYSKENFAEIDSSLTLKICSCVRFNSSALSKKATQSLTDKEKYAYGIDKDLVYYRLVGESLSSNKIIALKRTWNTYRNVEKLGLIKSSYVFCFYVFNAIKKRI